jgi:nucleoside-diphosphate-sugar epimerase
MSAIVVGGAGFLGSTLVDHLVRRRERVIVVDNLSTGELSNLEAAISSGLSTFVYADVTANIAAAIRGLECVATNGNDDLYCLMEPAGSALDLAERVGARFVTVASSGTPACTGRVPKVPARVARIGASFGPRMSADSSRFLHALFAAMALGDPLPVRGLEDRSLRLSYSKEIAATLRDAAEGLRRGRDDVVTNASDAVLTVGELCALLGSLVNRRFATCPPAFVDVLGEDAERDDRAVASGPAHRERLISALGRTYQWYRANSARLAVAGHRTA